MASNKFFRRLSTTVSAAISSSDKNKTSTKSSEQERSTQLKEDNPMEPTAPNVAMSDDTFDVQKLRDLLCKVSSSEELSDTSSISTFRHQGEHKKGSSKFAFGFSKKKTKLSVALFSIIDEFSRLRDNWVQRCQDNGTPLSAAVLSEFKKRIGQGTGKSSKPKLNFAKCDLSDRQLIILIEELAHRPVVAKMDLSGNQISTVGAEYLKKLLVYQLEVSTLLDPQQRVTATFLSDVTLASSKLYINKEVLDEIASVAGALAVCNIQNSIYELYMEILLPDTIDMATLTAMWEELLGTGPDRKVLLAGRPGFTAQTAAWSYLEAEALIVEEYRRRGLVQKVNASQERVLDSIKQTFEKRPSMSSVASSAEGSADSHHSTPDPEHLPPKPPSTKPGGSPSSSPGAPHRRHRSVPDASHTPSPPSTSYTGLPHSDSGIAMQADDRVAPAETESWEFAETEEPEFKQDQYLREHDAHAKLAAAESTEQHVLAMEDHNSDDGVVQEASSSGEAPSPQVYSQYALPAHTEVPMIAHRQSPIVSKIFNTSPVKGPTAPSSAGPVKSPSTSSPASLSSSKSDDVPRGPAPTSAVISQTAKSTARTVVQRSDVDGSMGDHETLHSAPVVAQRNGATLASLHPTPTSTKVSAASSLFRIVDDYAPCDSAVASKPSLEVRVFDGSSDTRTPDGSAAAIEIELVSADELDSSMFAIDLNDDELDNSMVPAAHSAQPAQPAPSFAPQQVGAATLPAITAESVVIHRAGDAISPSSSKFAVDETQDLYSLSPEASVGETSVTGVKQTSGVELWREIESKALQPATELQPAPKQKTAPEPEPRIYAVFGISRKKFTEHERDLLQSLPHCRDLRALDSGDRDGDVRPSSFVTCTRGGEVQGTQVLDLSSRDLMEAEFVSNEEAAELAPSVSVLILRDNRLSNLAALTLPFQFPAVQELDLGFNCMSGRLSMHMLPRTLLKLDLSHNGISDFSGVMVCANLKELNLGHNCIETIHALPRTLERLNLEHNYIWSKVCLRLLTLTPHLTSLSLIGNPVTLLVPGWAALLRSMSNKLAHLDGRPVEHAAAFVIGTPFVPATNVLKAPAPIPAANISRLSDKNIASASMQNVLNTSRGNPQQQRHRDVLRSQQYATAVAERDEKQRNYMKALRKVAHNTSPSKPEAEIQQLAKRLSSPKYKSTKFQKPKSKTTVGGFGCGRSEFDSFLAVQEDWTRKTDQNRPISVDQPTANSLPTSPPTKMTRPAALTALTEWSSYAALVLDAAVVLVNDLVTQWKSEFRITQLEDVHCLQANIDALRLSDWAGQLPVRVKHALHHVRRDTELVSTISNLHEQIRNYATLLQQLKGAMVMCARDSRSFCEPCRIILNSPLGKSLAVPAPIQALSPKPSKVDNAPLSAEPSAERKEETATEPIEGNRKRNASVDVVKSVDDIRSRLTQSFLKNSSASSANTSTNSLLYSPASTASSSRSLRSRYFQELTDCTLAPWQTSAADMLTQCAALLTEVLDFSTQSKGTDIDNERFLSNFKAQRGQLDFNKFDKLPKDVSAAMAASSVAHNAVVDAQTVIRAFGKLFTQVENVLLLYIKSGLDFESALQALMNSGLGRVVKKATQGVKAVTIVAPRSRSPSPKRVPSPKRSPQQSPKRSPVPVNGFRARQKSPLFVRTDGDEPPEAATPVQELVAQPVSAVPSPARQQPALSAKSSSQDLFDAAQEAFLTTTGPLSTTSQASRASRTSLGSAGIAFSELSPQSSVHSVLDGETVNEDLLEFKVIDANEDVVRMWIGTSESILGRAAVLLNTVIDLAATTPAVNVDHVLAFRSELAGLDLLAFEPPPKAVAAALLVCGDKELKATATVIRQKLDDYDNIFSQVDNALLLSWDDGYNFTKSFDVLMRTELGTRVNDSAYGIYDY